MGLPATLEILHASPKKQPPPKGGFVPARSFSGAQGVERHTLLIIEDDAGIRETMRLMLKIEGYDVEVCSNGQAALELLEKIRKPSLILLDLMMPVMDGWAFLAEIRKRPRLGKIPVVVITAFRGRAAKVQAHAVLEKPIDLDLLFSVVKKYCETPAIGDLGDEDE